MNVKDFVSASLKEILAGIEDAQKATGGGGINAKLGGKESSGSLINGGETGMFTRVDFDIAVSVETNGKGGGNLKVFGVGIEGGVDHKSGTASRITFSVPVRLPLGDSEMAERAKEKRIAGMRSVAEKIQRKL
ncbi:hypothetical protein [Rhizobium sp. 11_C7_N12_5]|uniref:hypothetical protein n=1 Tax=Rhizobium sp. 11_C7_N12_5 TaxID=3240770 RepID=UPI003F23C1E4